MSNRLSKETSPYLLEHQHNPVDWYPWGEEAFQKAKRENKPLFLSIGYSACHWCHVMARESFEDKETALLLNKSFVSIKVDREERPDVDHIYMSAVQAMTHSGGWPLSVFLTPELKPFYGGTYFPPIDRGQMPSFRRILTGISQAWNNRKAELEKSAAQLTTALGQMDAVSIEKLNSPTEILLEKAYQAYLGNFDETWGGFGEAPKFFHSMDLRFCLRHWFRTKDPKALNIVTTTLDAWSKGGILDQLGGGFHRYSTDQAWRVPHFEKMLYDNALISETYLEGFQATQNTVYLKTAQETLDYVLREMTAPEGGFYGAQDADTEGEEGKFYVWTYPEIYEHLEKELADTFCNFFQVVPEGNWEGRNILYQGRPLSEFAKGKDAAQIESDLDVAKRKLKKIRDERTRPHRDEKILTSWNGLMVASLAKGFRVLGDPRYLEAATKAGNFLWEKLRENNKLLHVYKDGVAKIQGYLDDHTHLIYGFLRLFEATGEVAWLEHAKELAKEILEKFSDGEGGFYMNSTEHEALILRPKENHDGAQPSGSSMAVTVLLELGALTGDTNLISEGEKALHAFEPYLEHVPRAVGQALLALDFHLGPPQEIFLIEGDDAPEFESSLDFLNRRFSPRSVFGFLRKEGSNPYLRGKVAVKGTTTAYFCEGFVCKEPLVGKEAIENCDGRNPS